MPAILILILLTLLLSVAGCDQKAGRGKGDNKINAAAQKAEPVKSLSERKLNGPVLMYYESGRLKAERTYKDAKLNGIYRMYYESGQLKVEGTYKDDKMDGAFRYYDQNGRLEVEETYRDNIPISRRVLNKS